MTKPFNFSEWKKEQTLVLADKGVEVKGASQTKLELVDDLIEAKLGAAITKLIRARFSDYVSARKNPTTIEELVDYASSHKQIGFGGLLVMAHFFEFLVDKYPQKTLFLNQFQFKAFRDHFRESLTENNFGTYQIYQEFLYSDKYAQMLKTLENFKIELPEDLIQIYSGQRFFQKLLVFMVEFGASASIVDSNMHGPVEKEIKGDPNLILLQMPEA